MSSVSAIVAVVASNYTNEWLDNKSMRSQSILINNRLNLDYTANVCIATYYNV